MQGRAQADCVGMWSKHCLADFVGPVPHKVAVRGPGGFRHPAQPSAGPTSADGCGSGRGLKEERAALARLPFPEVVSELEPLTVLCWHQRDQGNGISCVSYPSLYTMDYVGSCSSHRQKELILIQISF